MCCVLVFCVCVWVRNSNAIYFELVIVVMILREDNLCVFILYYFFSLIYLTNYFNHMLLIWNVTLRYYVFPLYPSVVPVFFQCSIVYFGSQLNWRVNKSMKVWNLRFSNRHQWFHLYHCDRNNAKIKLDTVTPLSAYACEQISEFPHPNLSTCLIET